MEVLLLIIGGVLFWWFFLKDDESKSEDQFTSSTRNSGRTSSQTSKSIKIQSSDFSSSKPTNQETLEKAIAEHLDVRFRYADKYGEITVRTITPTAIIPYEFESGSGHTLCVEGFCHLRKADRVFALKRISALKFDS
jgi:predicted DNA-binding transcriptional regulator YafY